MRQFYLTEHNCQIRYNACHERGWTDSYLLSMDGTVAGYGAVLGQQISNRDTIFEFYTLPQFRKQASKLFKVLISAAKVPFVECQTNDPLTTSMLYMFAHNIKSDVILWEAGVTSNFAVANATFRAWQDDDDMFDDDGQPAGDFVVEYEDEVVAAGGFLLHYNEPFADLYMATKKAHRRKGFGALVLQGVKDVCFKAGRVPAARCNIDNLASQATLWSAGLRPCGHMVKGTINSKRIANAGK